MKKVVTTAVVGIVSLLALSACGTGTSDYKQANGKPGQHSTASHKDAPSMTTAQKAALQSAPSYLSMGGFSRTGLIQQLSSKAGEGFKMADAVWAVKHANPDWNAQAVQSAKSYMDMGGFSKASLIQQLTSKSGEGFTPAQAAFAAHKVGY